MPSGGDRFGQPRKVFGTMSIDRKVSSSETGGALFVIENTDYSRGGPPRHLHHAQDEWFYVVEGEYVVEIGDERHRLGRGDSVFAPRGTAHAWSHVDEGRGRILVAFQPAGEMEAFFEAVSKVEGPASPEELHGLFGAHGMQVTGPPLPIE